MEDVKEVDRGDSGRLHLSRPESEGGSLVNI